MQKLAARNRLELALAIRKSEPNQGATPRQLSGSASPRSDLLAERSAKI